MNFTVTIKDEKERSPTWVMDGAIIPMKEVGDSMEAKLSTDGKKADVKCPQKSMLAKTGCHFTCDVSVIDEAHKVTFTCTDDKGNVDVKMD